MKKSVKGERNKFLLIWWKNSI